MPGTHLVITKSNIEELKKMKHSKTPMVCLIHAEWCGNCVVMKPEWQKLQKMKTLNTASVESSHLDDFKSDSTGKTFLPKDGQLYFPMIIISICGKMHKYEGERTAVAIQEFIVSKSVPGQPTIVKRTLRVVSNKPILKPVKVKPSKVPKTKPGIKVAKPAAAAKRKSKTGVKATKTK